MSPVSRFGVKMMFAYSFVFIVTAILFISGCEYFWAGLLAMAVLVLLVWLEHSWWTLKDKLKEFRAYKESVKAGNPEGIERAKRRVKEDLLTDMTIEPLSRAGIVALVGLIAIPLRIVATIKDTIKFRRRLASQR